MRIFEARNDFCIYVHEYIFCRNVLTTHHFKSDIKIHDNKRVYGVYMSLSRINETCAFPRSAELDFMK